MCGIARPRGRDSPVVRVPPDELAGEPPTPLLTLESPPLALEPAPAPPPPVASVSLVEPQAESIQVRPRMGKSALRMGVSLSLRTR